jgi:thiol-disulfide isomerase/thioredoxin
MDAEATLTPGRWSWVNVWATWCKPCVEEMPMLARWHSELEAAGTAYNLLFLSVDAQAADVQAFRDQHRSLPAGPRLKEISLLEGWLKSVGLDATAVLPIHLFVDPAGKVDCTRMGSLGVEDRAAVEALFRGTLGWSSAPGDGSP